MNMVDGSLNSFLPRTIRAAVDIFIGLNPMTNHLDPAVRADRCQFVHRTFETIENMTFPGRNYFKRKVIIVTANLAACHSSPPAASKRRNDSVHKKSSKEIRRKKNAIRRAMAADSAVFKPQYVTKKGREFNPALSLVTDSI
jgi:hypothetical protein